MDTTQGYRPSTLEAAAVPSAPLCTEIMNRTGSAQDVASEIASRLYALKDRLFGPEPAAGINARTDKAPAPAVFSDAYTERAMALHQTLCLIDGLTSDLNNRL